MSEPSQGVRSFEEYRDLYSSLSLRREDGILEATLNTDGDSLLWSEAAHHELPLAFADIALDRENRVVILIGTGENFSGPPATPETAVLPDGSPESWDATLSAARRMLVNLLEIEVPVIGAVNGPAYRHSEMPLLADIVIASEDALFEDRSHFPGGVLIPGDGVFVVYAAIMGINRARYFHLTGQRLDAEQAREWGLVNEVLPKAEVQARAWELARELAAKPLLTLRYTRQLITHQLKREMAELLPLGLAWESLGAVSEGSKR